MNWKGIWYCALLVPLASCGGGGDSDVPHEVGTGPVLPPQADGRAPSSLIQASDGNFYGTTAGGGLFGLGTVFRLTPTGEETVLYSFAGGTTDGANPQGLMQGHDGNLYGVTTSGGINACQLVETGSNTGGFTGCGVIYSVTLSGEETVIYSFQGVVPNTGLAQGQDGTLYGTTPSGGAACGDIGCGTVFQITAAGKQSILYSFTDQNGDGSQPTSVIVGADGNLYGTTGIGGQNDWGTIFRISAGGEDTVLYSFLGGSDGELPNGPLTQGSDGNFYGTEQFGGSRHGTIFQITPAGVKTILYAFNGGATDGSYPGPLTLGSDGNFYGTTESGGGTGCAGGCGTVFKFALPGNETPIYLAPEIDDGNSVMSPNLGNIIQGNDGYLYGTTDGDGQFGDGTVFRMTVAGVKTVIYSFGGK
jgi:uncharacterized repeat protein (TIGR03803 family)